MLPRRREVGVRGVGTVCGEGGNVRGSEVRVKERVGRRRRDRIMEITFSVVTGRPTFGAT